MLADLSPARQFLLRLCQSTNYGVIAGFLIDDREPIWGNESLVLTDLKLDSKDNIGYKTLLRWLEIPEFQAAYRRARREAVQQSVARLQQATGAAGLTVLKLMTDPNVPAAVRLRAAECVFEHAIKGIELEDLEARLTDLERAAETKGGQWR